MTQPHLFQPSIVTGQGIFNHFLIKNFYKSTQKESLLANLQNTLEQRINTNVYMHYRNGHGFWEFIISKFPTELCSIPPCPSFTLGSSMTARIWLTNWLGKVALKGHRSTQSAANVCLQRWHSLIYTPVSNKYGQNTWTHKLKGAFCILYSWHYG